MNSEQNKNDLWSRLGLDRNKLIAIVALSLILIVVVAIQFGGPSNAPPVTLANRTGLKESRKTGPAESRSSSTSAKRPVNALNKSETEPQRRLSRIPQNPPGKLTTKTPGTLSAVKVISDVPLSDVESIDARSSDARSSDVKSNGGEISDAGAAWKSVDLDQLELANPFELPLEIERMKAAKERERKRLRAAKEKKEREQAKQIYQATIDSAIQKLQKEGIRLVFISGNERAAQIGSRIVKVGDFIDGVKIAEIRENGSVILEVPDFDRSIAASFTKPALGN